MTRQWIRKCTLTVDDGGESIDLSNLRIRFTVNQKMLQSPTNASIIVSNLADATANKIQKEGQKVTLEAGYESGFGLIFKGEIIQKRKGRENPVDTYLGITATSGDTAYNFGTVRRTLAAGHTLRDQVDVVLEAWKPFGITAGHIADLGSTKAPRAAVLFGLGRDVLRDICFTVGAAWSIQNQKLQIVKNTETLPGDVIVLNSGTGLIGMPEQTINGIEGKCLLNPRMGPGTRIKIDQASIQMAEFSPNHQAGGKDGRMLTAPGSWPPTVNTRSCGAGIPGIPAATNGTRILLLSGRMGRTSRLRFSLWESGFRTD